MTSSIWDHTYHLAKKISKSEKHKPVQPVTSFTPYALLKFQPKQKINLFKTYIESIVLYGSETWTLSKQLEKCLDGTCTSNESTKHQLETTFYTGTDLWKPPKGFRCRQDKKKLLRRSLSTCERGNHICPSLLVSPTSEKRK